MSFYGNKKYSDLAVQIKSHKKRIDNYRRALQCVKVDQDYRMVITTNRVRYNGNTPQLTFSWELQRLDKYNEWVQVFQSKENWSVGNWDIGFSQTKDFERIVSKKILTHEELK